MKADKIFSVAIFKTLKNVFIKSEDKVGKRRTYFWNVLFASSQLNIHFQFNSSFNNSWN